MMKFLPQAVYMLVLCAITAVPSVARELWVMPARYAYVVEKYGSDDSSNFGAIDKWDTIELWGRCAEKYSIGGYEYRWVYGFSSKADAWKSISVANYRNLTSDRIKYTTRPKEDGYSEYTARLQVRNSAKNVIGFGSEGDLVVTAVDFAQFTSEHDYTDPATDKRNIIEQIARGRGLKYLYLNQSASGSWDATGEKSAGVLKAATSLALLAFQVHGHYSTTGGGNLTDDIFYESIVKGWAYVFSQLQQTPNYADPYPSDINKNKMMIRVVDLTDTEKKIYLYTHGITMVALAASINQVTSASNYQVTIRDITGSPVMVYYRDILKDMVDYAAWAQNDSNKTLSSGEPYFSGYGGWDYYEGNRDMRGDLSVMMWPALGMASIQEVWKSVETSGFAAPDFVRERLLSYMRKAQYQDSSREYNGSAIYHWFHEEEPNFSVPMNSFYQYKNDFENSEGVDPLQKVIPPDTVGRRYDVSTTSLLTLAYYLSLDTTGPTPACMCGAPRCNSQKTDFVLDKNSTVLADSCMRVRSAINFLTTNKKTNPDGSLRTAAEPYNFLSLKGPHGMPMLYNMYCIKKALSLYNYKLGGVGDGVCDGGHWQELYSAAVLQLQDTADGSFESDEYYVDGNNTSGNRMLGTTLGVLLLADDVFAPPFRVILRTDRRGDSTETLARR